MQIQPLSVAVRRLEEVVTASVLPPNVLAANHQSLVTLKAFLETLKPPNGYPAACMKTVRFGVQRGGRLQAVSCKLKTTGGDCSRLVVTHLGQLLESAGVQPPHFWFDGGEFAPSKSGVAAPGSGVAVGEGSDAAAHGSESSSSAVDASSGDAHLETSSSEEGADSSSAGAADGEEGSSPGQVTPPTLEEVAAVRKQAMEAGGCLLVSAHVPVESWGRSTAASSFCITTHG